jgi:hypothetical protein
MRVDANYSMQLADVHDHRQALHAPASRISSPIVVCIVVGGPCVASILLVNIFAVFDLVL